MSTGTEEELLEIYRKTKVEKSTDALTKLLVQYVERFGDTLVTERILSLNTQSLRYTNARLREWKRKKESGEIKNESPLSWLWNYMSDQTLVNKDFETLYTTFGCLLSLLVKGNGQESEIDLTFFTSIKNLEIHHSKIVFVRGAENIEKLQLLDCVLVDLDMFSSLRHIYVRNSPNISWFSANKVVSTLQTIHVSNDFKAIPSTPVNDLESTLTPTLIKLKSLSSILTTNSGKYWDNLTELCVNYCGLNYMVEDLVGVDSVGIRFASNLERLDISHNKILHILQSRALHSQQGEEIDHSNESRILESNVQLAKLISLDLSFNRLQDVERPSLSLFSNLRFLNLSHNFLRSTLGIADALGQSLETLDLSKNRIDNWDEVKRLRGLKRLKSLILTGNKGLTETLNYRLLVCSYFSKHHEFSLDGQIATKWELEYGQKKGATDTGIVSQILASVPINGSRGNRISPPNSTDGSYSTSSDDTTVMEGNMQGWNTLPLATLTETNNVSASTENEDEEKKNKSKGHKKKKKKKKNRIVDDIPEVILGLPQTEPNSLEQNRSEVPIEDDEEVTDPAAVQDDYFARISSNYRSSSDHSSDEDQPKNKNKRESSSFKSSTSFDYEDLIDKSRVESVQRHVEALKRDGGDQWLLILSGSEYVRDDSEPDGKREQELSNKQVEDEQHKEKRKNQIAQEQQEIESVQSVVITDQEEIQSIQEKGKLRNRRKQEQRQRDLLQMENDYNDLRPGLRIDTIPILSVSFRAASDVIHVPEAISSKQPAEQLSEDQRIVMVRTSIDQSQQNPTLQPKEELSSGPEDHPQPKSMNKQKVDNSNILENIIKEDTKSEHLDGLPTVPATSSGRKQSVIIKNNAVRKQNSSTIVKPERSVRTVGKQITAPSKLIVNRTSSAVIKKPTTIQQTSSTENFEEYYDEFEKDKDTGSNSVTSVDITIGDDNLLEELLKEEIDDVELPKEVPMARVSNFKTNIDLDEILNKEDDDIDTSQEPYLLSMEDNAVMTALVSPVTHAGPSADLFSTTKEISFVVGSDGKSIRPGENIQQSAHVKIEITSANSPVCTTTIITVHQSAIKNEWRLLWLFELCKQDSSITKSAFPSIIFGDKQPIVDGDKLAKLFVVGRITDRIMYYIEGENQENFFADILLPTLNQYYRSAEELRTEKIIQGINTRLKDNLKRDIEPLFQRSQGTVIDAISESFLKSKSDSLHSQRFKSLKKNLKLNNSLMPYYRDMLVGNSQHKKFDPDRQRFGVKLIISDESNWSLHCNMHVFDGVEPERLLHVIYANFVVLGQSPNSPSHKEWSVAVVLSNRYFYLLQDCNYMLEGLDQLAAARVLPMLVKQPLDHLQRIHMSYEEQYMRLDFDQHSYLLITRCSLVSKHIVQSCLDALIVSDKHDCLERLELVTYHTPFLQTLSEAVNDCQNIILSPEQQSSLTLPLHQGSKIRAYGLVFWKKQGDYDNPPNLPIHSHDYPSNIYLTTSIQSGKKKRVVMPGTPLIPASLIISDDHVLLCIETKLYDWPQHLSSSTYAISVFSKRPLSEIIHIEKSSRNILEFVLVFRSRDKLDEYDKEESSSNESNKKPASDRWIIVTQDEFTREVLIKKFVQVVSEKYHLDLDVTNGSRDKIKTVLRSKSRIIIHNGQNISSNAVASSVPSTTVSIQSISSSVGSNNQFIDDYNEKAIKEIQNTRYSSRNIRKTIVPKQIENKSATEDVVNNSETATKTRIIINPRKQ